MKNCKIKQVLVPYAIVGEFIVADLDYLLFVTKSEYHINNMEKIKYVSVSENVSLKFSNLKPNELSKNIKSIKFTPEQFLKHYLK